MVAKYRDGATVAGFQWSFIPDVVTTVSGDTVPEMEMAMTAAVASRELPAGIARVDATHVRLPDGRVVGPGLHVYEIPAPAGSRVSAQRTTTRTADATPLLAASSATGVIALSDCNSLSRCSALVPATAGTFVVSAVVDGELRSASARLEAARESPPKVVVDCGNSVMRGGQVRCRIRTEPARLATITRLKSVADGRVLVDAEVQFPLTKEKPEYPWEGRAATNTVVTAWVTVTEGAGGTLSGSGSFSVISRMGSTPWPNQDPPNPLPTPAKSSGRLLSGSYPFFSFRNDGGLSWEPGSLGASFWPTGAAEYLVLRQGPNSGIAFLTRAQLLNQRATEAVYAVSIAPDDPFYLLQTGGIGPRGVRYCSGGDLDRLRGQIIQHEHGHGIEQQKELDAVRATLESTILFLDQSAGASSPVTQAAAWLDRVETLYFDVPVALADTRLDSGVGPYTPTPPNCVARWP